MADMPRKIPPKNLARAKKNCHLNKRKTAADKTAAAWRGYFSSYDLPVNSPYSTIASTGLIASTITQKTSSCKLIDFLPKGLSCG